MFVYKYLYTCSCIVPKINLISLSLFLYAQCIYIWFQDFLFISGYMPFHYDLPWCSFHHISCVWGSLTVLDLWVYCCHQFRKFLVTTSSNILVPDSPLSLSFLSVSPRTPTTHVRLLKVVTPQWYCIYFVVCFYSLFSLFQFA